MIHVSSHPLIADKIHQLRDLKLKATEFRSLIDQICSLLAYEATLHLPTKSVIKI